MMVALLLTYYSDSFHGEMAWVLDDTLGWAFADIATSSEV